MSSTDESKLEAALRGAGEVDITFIEERLKVHEADPSIKIGCRPIAVRGIPIVGPTLVTYVRASDARGEYWYVLDWSKAKNSTVPEETIVDSEESAKRLVLVTLRAAAAAKLL